MTHTQDQLQALDMLKQWHGQHEQLFATVNGAAGTGKTTITKEFIRSLGLLPSKVAVSAPTHKAKKVIQRVTGYTGTTIQKLLGLRPNTDIENFNINRPQFDPLGSDELQYYKLVLLDESSMVNKSLYGLLKKKAERYGVKVLFLGDEYQLPPVGETISKVFSDVKYKATLTTVVRQGNENPMTDVLIALREDVRLGTNNGIAMLTSMKEQVVNDKGFRCLTKTADEQFGNGIDTFGNEALKFYFSTEYQHSQDYFKFISYTNESVETWSKAFRDKILGDKSSVPFNEGEFLLGYNSILNKKTNDLILENSEEYVITRVEKGNSPLDIPGYYIDLEAEESGSRRVFVVDPNDIVLFKAICEEKLNAAKAYGGGYWNSFYTFKNAHLLLESIYKNPNLPKYYRNNLLCKKDLYYNYGVTAHKSQGSTYANVGINLANIYGIKDVSLRNRLLYVALSRAKDLNLILVK